MGGATMRESGGEGPGDGGRVCKVAGAGLGGGLLPGGEDFVFHMKLTLLTFCILVLGGGVACRSAGKKRDTAETREMARLGDPAPAAQTGGYYRLKGSVNGFYHNIPNFTDVLPNRFLMHGHIVQLLDASAGDGWARVKNEDLEIGYVNFENIKIVPPDKQPQPKKREMDEELDQNMRLE